MSAGEERVDHREHKSQKRGETQSGERRHRKSSRHHSRRHHHHSSKEDEHSSRHHHRRHRHHHHHSSRRHHRRHRNHHSKYEAQIEMDEDEFKDIEDEYLQQTEPPQENAEPTNKLRPFHEYPHQGHNVGDYHFNLYECFRPTGEILGYGAFAVVIRVVDMRWGEHRQLAVKKNFNAFQTVPDARKLLRELMILKHFTDNPQDSLMGLHGVVVPPQEQRLTFDSICLVMSQHESNLGRVIEHKMTLAAPHIARIVYQILGGVRALHAAGIIHRDLKPDNILINQNCQVKVIDYNMSREIPADDDGVLLSDVVVARWYRAPEIVLTKGGYSEKIDLWSVGCIMAEIYLKSPLFATASNSLELIRLSMQLLGTPQGDLSWITRVEESGFSYFDYVSGTDYEPQDMSIIFPDASPVEMEVLSKLLSINPSERLSAAEAMRLPFFRGQKKIRGRDRPFVMPPYVRRMMYGDVSIDELRSVTFDVLANFNRTVLGNNDRSLAGQQAMSNPQSTRTSTGKRPRVPVGPFTP